MNMERYTVKSGDTLYDIAYSYGVPVEAIRRANGLDDPNVLYVGQELVIPTSDRPMWYVVHYGDTLSSIAKRFFTSVDELVRLNSISDPDSIMPDQRLRIR